MHQHSLKAYNEEVEKLSGRKQTIARMLAMFKMAVTDREIMEILHFTDMNSVRPRITELIKAGLVKEIGSKKDKVTGKTVRIVKANIKIKVPF